MATTTDFSYDFSLDFARHLDEKDELAAFRNEFYIPPARKGPALYFCGNSLGLQPKRTRGALWVELEKWAKEGIDGFFSKEDGWLKYHEYLAPMAAKVVGGKPEEVIVMNALTVNLHLLMVSFYRPTRDRFKILMEAGAFPSDQYAFASQVQFHGYDPAEAIVEVAPREGEATLRTADILTAIEQHGSETALVLFSGLQYFTGQFFDMEAITRKGHEVGAVVGWDLAHAAGNVPMKLHDWGVDFAAWCNYKYLNSGPGAVSGAFVHERHAQNPDLPRFAGWWGHDLEARFLMRKGFQPMYGAAGWQLSTAQVLPMAAHKASLELFEQAGMAALRQKSIRMTGFLAYIFDELNAQGKSFEFLTPKDPAQRGAQLSLFVGPEGKSLFDYLLKNDVVADWREYNLPDGKEGGVIRLAPAPMYNTFEEVYRLGELLAAY
jgi:kynureninase